MQRVDTQRLTIAVGEEEPVEAGFSPFLLLLLLGAGAAVALQEEEPSS